ncbi:MAG: AMP-binding protein, partial [Betaproteobacteria bacterium]
MTVPAALLPLVDPAAAGAVVAWSRGRAVTGHEFEAAAATLAARLPAARHAVNLCRDRYSFALGVAACALRGVLTLLPAARTAAVLADLAAGHEDLLFLLDAQDSSGDLPGPLWRIDPPALASPAAAATSLALPADQVVLRMYTSGTTGRPQAQDKRWGSLVRNRSGQAARLREEGLPAAALLGTVPAQHSYGFESTVLLAWAGAGALCDGQPLFPADVAAALQALPRPRALVSTPFHLRTMLDTPIDLPEVDFVLSATAPLDAALAHRVETRLRAPLIEIYGATECGQLATRRPTCAATWVAYDGVYITLDEWGHPLADSCQVGKRKRGASCVPLLLATSDRGRARCLFRRVAATSRTS